VYPFPFSKKSVTLAVERMVSEALGDFGGSLWRLGRDATWAGFESWPKRRILGCSFLTIAIYVMVGTGYFLLLIAVSCFPCALALMRSYSFHARDQR
jgi:hypothetical protein